MRPGPRSSFVFLFRVPIQEGTVAEQITATWTGAVNIGACRVDWGSNVPSQEEWNTKGSTGSGSPNIGQNTKGMRKAYADGAILVPSGRWPPNVVFVHGPGCQKTGTRRVKASIERSRSSSTSIGKQTDSFVLGYADEDGLETIAAWECCPGCPVGLLDQQTGVLQSGGPLDTERIVSPNKTYGRRPKELVGVYGRDVGGASRFFPQFADEGDLWGWLSALVTPVRES
jgi:hypothetical protein